MKIAGYVGKPANEDFWAWMGRMAIRAAQVGQHFGEVTHLEAVLMGSFDHCTIASASLRDGAQVRIKTTDLNPAHWIVLDVPAWDVVAATDWFERNAGTPYSKLGAAASASPMAGLVIKAAGLEVTELGQWCSRAVPQSAGVVGAEDLSPSEVFTLAWALPGTRDVTKAFFGGARHAAG